MKTKNTFLILGTLIMIYFLPNGIALADNTTNDFHLRYHFIFPEDDGHNIRGRMLLEITNIGPTAAENITMRIEEPNNYIIGTGAIQAGNLPPGGIAVQDTDFSFQLPPEKENIEEPLWRIEYTDPLGKKQTAVIMGEAEPVE